ncbi:MAG: Mor transcription activator family protein [Spirulina sp.]
MPPTLSDEEFQRLLEEFEEEFKPLLPNLLIDIWDYCSREAALKIWRKYSGLNLYIPIQTSEDHALFDLIGKNAMDSLTYNWGGTGIDIPKAVFLRNFFRNLRIFSIYSEVKTYRDTSKKLRIEGYVISETGVKSVIKRYSGIFNFN